jgi:diguanylate cyclase (GGDEF)-like protein
MVRKYRPTRTSGYTVLLVDDDADYVHATRLLLEGEGHRVVVAANGGDALATVRSERVDLMLLDFFMPGMTGEQVVRELRTFDQQLQVVLQTGYATERPARALLRELEIQGYYDKSEGPEKLLLWTESALKAREALRAVERSRSGMRLVLDSAPVLHRLQPRRDLLESALSTLCKLVMTDHGFFVSASRLRNEESGAAALAERLPPLVARGRFASSNDPLLLLAGDAGAQLAEVIRTGAIATIGSASAVPLGVGGSALGVFVVDRVLADADDELVRIFAAQVTMAAQNGELYEMAALDPLTGVHARRFFEDWLRRELRTALRARSPITLLMVDMDDLKRINDAGGHLAGDAALATLGKALRQAMRENDIVGRFGGDEFSIVLPQTGEDGAEHVCARIRAALADATVDINGARAPLHASIGAATLPAHEFGRGHFADPIPAGYFEAVRDELVSAADTALYAAKRQGKNQARRAASIPWPRLPLSAS